MHSAAVFGNDEAIKLMINAGVDPFIKDDYGFNAMHYAVFLSRSAKNDSPVCRMRSPTERCR